MEPDVLSLADPISLSESPFAQYLADAGLDDEADATVAASTCDDVACASTETIRASHHVGSERRWLIPTLLSIGGGIAAVSLVAWMGWVRRQDRPLAVTKAAAGGFAGAVAVLGSIWGMRQRLAIIPQVELEAERQASNKDALELAWASLEKALTSRYRYLREVDLVSRGYKLQSQALPSAWAADSFRKLDHRKLLVSCLDMTARAATSALAVLPNAPELDLLHDAIDKLVSDATAEYSLATIKDLLFTTRELVAIVLDDAELVPTHSLDDLVRALECATRRLAQSDPFVTPAGQTASTSPSVTSTERSNPVVSNLALVHAHLHTMHIKTHLALTETHDDPIALAAYLTAMPADVEYLTSLLAHLRVLADGPHAPIAPDDLPPDEQDMTLMHASAGRMILADEDMDDTLDAEAWTGEVDMQDEAEAEATVRPRSTLSRDERIALRKQQMAEQAAARVAMSSTLQFVGELKNVLGQRRDRSD